MTRSLRDVSGARVEVRFDGVSKGATTAAGQVRSAIRSVGNEADRGEKRMSLLTRTIRYSFVRAAFAASAGIAGLAGSIAYAGIKFDNMKQQATIAFSTMLGSTSKANQFLGELQKFANATPFEFPQLIQTSQRLLAMGFNAKQVVPTLTAIGDAVAGLGGNAQTMDRITTALGQIQAKGKASAEEMMQLTEAGIPAWQMLADKIGVTVPEAMAQVTKGAISSGVTIAAVTEGMEKNFGGMMEKQSHTFGGLLSTMKDTFTQISGTVMAPFFSLATKGFQKIVDYTSRPEFTAGVKRFADELGTRVTKAAREAIDFFVTHWGQIKSIFSTAWAAVKLGVEAFKIVVSVSQSAARELGGWKPLLFGLVGAFAGLKVAVAGFMLYTRIQAIITAGTIRAALITTGIGAVVVALGFAIGLIIAHWDRVKKAIRAFGDWVSAHAKALIFLPFVGWMIVLVGETIKHWAKIKATVRNAARAMTQFVATAFNWMVKTAIETALKIVEPFSHLPGSMGGWARKAKDRLHEEMTSMILDAGRQGTTMGDSLGRNYYSAISAWATRAGQLTAGLGGGGDPGNPKAGGQDAGTEFGLVTKARSLGVGSGGVGGTSGHGGISKPGAAFDCSGYIYQVFTQTGFQGFPGTSETQWSVMDGPNWTSEKIPVAKAQPGDVVFMVGAGFAPPGHVGFVDSGSGASAKVVAYSYKSGRPPSVRTLGSIGDLVGIKRFYIVKKDEKGGGKKPPPSVAPPAAAPAIVAPSDALYDVDSGDLTGAASGGGLGKGAGAKKLTPAEKAARAKASAQKSAAIMRDQVDEIAKQAERLPISMRAVVAPKMKALREELANVVDARSLAKARRDLAAFRTLVAAEVTIQKAVDVVRGQARTLSTAIGRLPADARAILAPKMAKLRIDLAHVTDAKTLAKVKADLKKIQDAVKAAIAALEKIVNDRRDAYANAFGNLAEKALAVFDAKTAKLIEKAHAAAKGFGFDVFEGSLTPTEQKLRDREAAKSVADAKARIDDLVAKREEAIKAEADAAAARADLQRGEEETDDEYAKRVADAEAELAQKVVDTRKARAEAEAAITAERYDQETTALQAQADLERKAADDSLAAERARIEDERMLLRDRFTARLDQIKAGFANETLTAEEAQAQTLAAMAEFGVNFQEAGGLIGSYFAQGFSDALAEVAKTVKALRDAVDDLSRATGTPPGATPKVPAPPDDRGNNAPPAETSAQRALRLRSEALNRRYGLAEGGKVPGQYVGRRDTVMTGLTQGETVIDRSLTAALEREFLGGARRAGRASLDGATIYVLGTTEREVAAALKRIVDGAPTIPGYSSNQ